MAIGPEVPAAALLETWQHLLTGVPDGWVRAGPGALAGVTGVGIPTLNGVWVESLDVDADVVADLLDEVAASGLPHCLQVRPDYADRVTRVAAARGMIRDERLIPLMVLEDPGRLGAAVAADGLVIREIAPPEAHRHARLAAAGFEAPVEAFIQLMTPSILAVPGVRCYIGEVGDEPVTTGLGVTVGSYVGIFNIATPPAHRRHGYGAAVTARAVADGLAAGALWAWLQSSKPGYPIYERLGFRTAEAWSSWISPTATDR
jgi:N-acetylglutamate synthase